MRHLSTLVVLIVLLGLATAAQSQPEPRLYLPSLFAPAPALPPPDAVSERLSVPEGFAVRLFASGFRAPRLMTIGPDDLLYLAEPGANRIVRLPDGDGDGLADGVELVASDLDGVHSVEWHDGALFAALNDRVVRLDDGNGDGDMDDEGERTVLTDLPCCGGHNTRTLHFGPDGMLYVSAGSSGNITIETDRRRATIMRFNPDGSIPADNPYATSADPNLRPVWAEGLRNSVDFVFTPAGRLWATHNGSDLLGDDAPPEEIVIDVERDGHYGWPYCFTSQIGVVPAGAQEIHDLRVPFDNHIQSCTQVRPALFTANAHQAPLGVAYYAAAAFPADYRGDLYVAYHGSWNAERNPRDCRVERIIVEAGKPLRAEPFLTGFRDNDQEHCRAAWGRPAGVVVGADGALFVSDDKNGNIYRIVYVGED